MKQNKLIWQIFPANIAILALTVISVAWLGETSLQSFYLAELEKGLVARAHLIKPVVREMIEQAAVEQLRHYVKNSGREANTRITVILPQGKVLADSNEEPEAMESHHNREEILTALQGKVGKSLRYSKTLSKEMLYVAVPIYTKEIRQSDAPEGSAIVGVLRMSVPVTAIEFALQSISMRVLIGVLFFVFLAAIASLLVSRNISRPLEEMKRAAERYSKGNFNQKMSAFKGVSASLEVATLAASMDRMAEEINTRIETIESQRNELETVFSSMVESVIAVDSEERVLNINEAAAKLLGIKRENAKGKIIQEVLRNFNLQQQVVKVLESGASVEDEITHLDNGGVRYLQTHLVSLNDKNNKVLGALVVLNDVTSLRRLENVRRDFVANVSHELRTPITSIRGYVETLLDGALEDRENSIKFLEIVLRQSERLNEIIDDLLALSRIEQEADYGQIMLERGSLCMVLDAAVETCELRAEQEGVNIELQCPEGIYVEMNETLIEQALVNLLVNGIKYSKKGDVITVAAKVYEEAGRKMVKIDVIDTGVGIAPKHLPRLFERFYRSDKARSRKQGGTGLGLAIVKHIVIAHNGSVDVKSKLGEGSTFTIILPGAEMV